MSIVFHLVMDFLLLACRAYVIKKLWLWFIVSAFTAIPPISSGTAFGIALFLSIVTEQKFFSREEIDKMKESQITYYETLINFIARLLPLLWVLGLGWLVH